MIKIFNFKNKFKLLIISKKNFINNIKIFNFKN